MNYSSQVLHRLRDAQLVEIFDAQVDDKVMFTILAVLNFTCYLMQLSTFLGSFSLFLELPIRIEVFKPLNRKLLGFKRSNSL
jgi:hypothetical protein